MEYTYPQSLLGRVVEDGVRFAITKIRPKRWYNKRYYWVVYSSNQQRHIRYMFGYNWTQNGAEKSARFYIDKINDGRYIY
jgi:hypothetical protein